VIKSTVGQDGHKGILDEMAIVSRSGSFEGEMVCLSPYERS